MLLFDCLIGFDTLWNVDQMITDILSKTFHTVDFVYLSYRDLYGLFCNIHSVWLNMTVEPGSSTLTVLAYGVIL